MIDDLVADLESDEGWRDKPYRDHLGYLTIGYGFLIDERKAVSLPKAVGQHWLLILVNQKIQELARRWPDFDVQPEDVQRALGNMCYNLGVSGVLNFKHMLQALEDGDRAAAADEALDSKWATQVPDRAERVAALIRGEDE